MSDPLLHHKEKIRARRMKTPFRSFVREIASWCPIGFYRVDGHISRYPESERNGRLVDAKTFIGYGYGDLARRDYDPSRPFFDQFAELYRESAHPLLWDFGGMVENCTYSDTVGWGVRNAYLTVSAGMDCENLTYSFRVIDHCSDIHNCVGITHGCANIYMSSGVTRSYQVFYSRYIMDSSDVWLSTNLLGCRECIACHSLANQSYCIENIHYEKSEYLARKAHYLADKRDFFARYCALSNHSDNPGSTDSVGKYLIHCDHVENGLYVHHVHNGRNLIMVGHGEDITDCRDNVESWTQAEHSYGNMGCSP